MLTLVVLMILASQGSTAFLACFITVLHYLAKVFYFLIWIEVLQWKMSPAFLTLSCKDFTLWASSFNFFRERFFICMYFLVVNYIMVGRWTRSCASSAFSDTEFEKAVASIARQTIIMILENNCKDKMILFFNMNF